MESWLIKMEGRCMIDVLMTLGISGYGKPMAGRDIH